MDSFNLYREAKNQYDKLVPEKNNGLILLSLYSNYQDKEFTEENIISVINKVFKDQGLGDSRNEYNRNNTIILGLQESFLWRNASRKTYQFKKYGLELCQNIEKRLIEKYDPAKIKRFFAELHKSLLENIKKKEDFKQWMEDHFELRLPILTSQIEILDQQVNESVIEFKTGVKSEDRGILKILKEIEIRLDVIKGQAKELRDAFQISYDIDDLLLGILEENRDLDYTQSIQRVQVFHDNSRSQLEQVSKRIEKIKPRIREFIYDFNKKNFDRKTNKLIDHLLKNSKVIRDRGSKKIQLPDNLPVLQIKSTIHNPRFEIIPIRQISPKLPMEVTKRKIDTIKKSQLLQKTLEWKHDKERIKYWSDKILYDLEQKGSVNFTPYFFDIVKEDRLKIAVKTAHSIIRKKNIGRNRYQIKINKERTQANRKTSISIWQMTLQIPR